jgi:CelD/BcsL family acetyltransferase involved in cellulose biosynthesis
MSSLRVESVASLESIGDEWDLLAERSRNVFATREWAQAWWNANADSKELRTAVCRAPGGGVVGILPLVVSTAGRLRLLRFLGYGPADELGPVCDPAHREDVAVALRELLSEELGRASVFLGERMPAGAKWDALLDAKVLVRESSPVLRVETPTWDAYLASKSRNFREQVGRRERRLLKSHDVRYRLTDAAHLQDDLTTLFALHRARWRAAGADAFAGAREAFHRDFAARALARGWLRLWILELDGRPAAAWYGFRFAGAESYYQSGRDPAFESESVGFVLMAHTIREAMEAGIAEYRLLRGGEDYKSRFATHDDEVETVGLAGGLTGRAAILSAAAARRLPPALRRRVVGVIGRP